MKKQMNYTAFNELTVEELKKLSLKKDHLG